MLPNMSGLSAQSRATHVLQQANTNKERRPGALSGLPENLEHVQRQRCDEANAAECVGDWKAQPKNLCCIPKRLYDQKIVICRWSPAARDSNGTPPRPFRLSSGYDLARLLSFPLLPFHWGSDCSSSSPAQTG